MIKTEENIGKMFLNLEVIFFSNIKKTLIKIIGAIESRKINVSSEKSFKNFNKIIKATYNIPAINRIIHLVVLLIVMKVSILKYEGSIV